ncbi:hypothetical protein ISS85_04270 [Candidatus Microgenomates bacterium]|nr:hypothetical protein [Candidatus Microgenomates bacterium]
MAGREMLRNCPEVRGKIQLAQEQITEKGAQTIICSRCSTQFDVTKNGAFPLADYCVYGLSQLNPESEVDGYFDSDE